MKNFILAILALLTITGQGLKAQSGTPSDTLTNWYNDIDYLAEKLTEVHPRFKVCGLPGEMDSLKEDIKQKVRSLPDYQITVELQKLLASSGDGHTLLYPFGMKKGTLISIPLMFWLFNDGLFVIDAPESRFIGKKVIKIGDLAVDELLQRMKPYISHDNTQQFLWAAPFYFTLTDFLVAAGAIQVRDSAQIEFAGGLKHTFTASPVDPEKLEIKLIPPKTGKAAAWLLHRNEHFRTEEIRPGVLYIAVNTMNDSPSKTLEAFGKELWERLKAYKKMILDLRYNNGGEALKADALFRTCVAFDLQGGRIAVMTGRMTFSAAQTFASRIDQWTGAFFAGEKTGSKPNHYGNERPFKLPYSGIRGTISSGYNQPVSVNDTRMYITPDIEVSVNSVSYFSGLDPELDAVLNELDKK